MIYQESSHGGDFEGPLWQCSSQWEWKFKEGSGWHFLMVRSLYLESNSERKLMEGSTDSDICVVLQRAFTIWSPRGM